MAKIVVSHSLELVDFATRVVELASPTVFFGKKMFLVTVLGAILISRLPREKLLSQA